MKKRIVLVLTLLVAFFGFMGLSISNKQVEVHAAGDHTTVISDLTAVINNIPSRAILSFPVTHKSVHGNIIEFEVPENQNVIKYSEEAHWMVVNRPTDADATVVITVKVTGENNVTESDSKPVTVPKGITTTREFDINYKLNEGTNHEDNPDSYKLGQDTIVLQDPTRSGYLFDGWYTGFDENTGIYSNKIEKILVGSMNNYTLYAKWTKMAFDISHVSFITEPDYEYDGTAKTPEVQVENPYGDGYLEQGEDKDYVVTYQNNTDATSEEVKAKAIVTGKGRYEGSEVELTFDIAKKDLTITIEDAGKVYGEEDPNSFVHSSVGLVEADKDDNLGIYREDSGNNNVGDYTIKSSYVNSNYDITVNEGVFTISPATLTLTPKDSKTYNFGITPTWSIVDFKVAGLISPDTTDVLEGSISATYYKNEEEDNLTTAGTYKAVFSGLSADNYNIVFDDGEVNVVVANVNFVPAQTYTYNGQPQELKVIAKDNSSQEITDATISYTTNNTYTNANANGEYYSIGVRFDHLVYGIVEQTVQIRIEKADLTITATPQSKTYGEGDPSVDEEGKSVYFSANLVNNEVIDLDWISRKAGENVKVGGYEVTLDTTELSKNYNIDENSTTTTTLTINKANLTITATPQSKTYGEVDPSVDKEGKSVYFSANLVNGDEIDLDWISRKAGEDVKDGGYEVTLDTTKLESNYNIFGNTTTTLTINKANLTITATPQSKTYGEVDPSVDENGKSVYFKADGLVNGDIINLNWIDREAGEDVKDGGYEVTLDTTELSKNYNIFGNTTTVLTIKPFDLTGKVVLSLSTYDNYTQQGEIAPEPTVIVMYNDNEITSFNEPVYSYENEHTYLGNATVSVTFNGNYSGTASTNFVVTELPRALEDGRVISDAMVEITSVANGQLLPTAKYGSTVLWISDNTGVSVVEGKVVIDEAQLNGTTVKLTVYIDFEDGADVREFSLNVNTSKQNITIGDVVIEEVPGNLNVEVEDVQESQESANYVVEGEELLGAYNITFTDKSTSVENKNPGTVTVKLPVPDGYNQQNSSELKVYHILDNGDRSDPISFEYVDGYLVFEASSFSPYVIVGVKKYTVKWIVEGETVKTDTVKHGDTPVYGGETPVKVADAEFTYSFDGWDSIVGAIYGDKTYVAKFSSTKNKYTITWKNDDGTELRTDKVEYGVTPAYDGTPTKEEDETYTYTFMRWDPEITSVTGDAIYTAQYESIEKVTNEATWITADFSKLSTSTSYISGETSEGWEYTNSAILKGGTTDSSPAFKFIGSDDTTKAVTINGNTSKKGTLISPTLTGGIQRISFNYGYAFSEKYGVDINITITEISTGNQIVLNLKKTNEDVVQKTSYLAEFTLETPIDGDFTIEFTNNCPSSKASNADRLSLWNVSWLSVKSNSDSTLEPPVYNHNICLECDGCKTSNCECTLNDCVCDESNDVDKITETLTFDDKNKRTEFSSEKQVWTENNIVITNTKANSTSDIADYSNPARFYKNSLINIKANNNNITKIIFNVNSKDSTVNDLYSSLMAAGHGPSMDGNTITIELNSNSLSFILVSGKVFLDSIIVTYQLPLNN